MATETSAAQESQGSENKSEQNPVPVKKIRAAILGFSIPVMEALDKAGLPFVGVVPPDFESYMIEHNIPYVCWSFGKFNEHSGQLTEKLKEFGVEFVVPLYEETVEWAGAVNGVFRDDPRLFNRGMLFRDKAMMKRKALMSGIRVGVFEEADNKEDLRKFFKRVNHALLKLDHEEQDPIHLKPNSAAGCKGHRFIRSYEDIELVPDEEFPCLLESHLAGQEFSCEVFHGNP